MNVERYTKIAKAACGLLIAIGITLTPDQTDWLLKLVGAVGAVAYSIEAYLKKK